MRTNYNKIKDDAGKKPEEPIDADTSKETTKPDKPKKPPHAVVSNCSRLNVRESNSKDSKVLCVLNDGDKITIIAKDVLWTHIKLANKTEGYVMTDFIKEV